jgi:hypothetical protein
MTTSMVRVALTSPYLSDKPFVSLPKRVNIGFRNHANGRSERVKVGCLRSDGKSLYTKKLKFSRYRYYFFDENVNSYINFQ